MAHKVAPKLAEVRKAVAVRLKYVEQAAQSPMLRGQIDEAVRAALNDLLLQCNWVELRQRRETKLIDKQNIYDFPDNFDPGRIESITVVSDKGARYRLEAGVRSYERDEYRFTERTGMPLRYEFINEEMHLYPAPDGEQYPTLEIEGFYRPSEPVNDDDSIPVQKEAIIRLATAYMKPDGVREREVALALHYAQGLRSLNSENETIQIGGHLSRKHPYTKRRGAYGRNGYGFRRRMESE